MAAKVRVRPLSSVGHARARCADTEHVHQEREQDVPAAADCALGPVLRLPGEGRTGRGVPMTDVPSSTPLISCAKNVDLTRERAESDSATVDTGQITEHVYPHHKVAFRVGV
jgi:hypothetical protein